METFATQKITRAEVPDASIPGKTFPRTKISRQKVTIQEITREKITGKEVPDQKIPRKKITTKIKQSTESSEVPLQVPLTSAKGQVVVFSFPVSRAISAKRTKQL